MLMSDTDSAAHERFVWLPTGSFYRMLETNVLLHVSIVEKQRYHERRNISRHPNSLPDAQPPSTPARSVW